MYSFRNKFFNRPVITGTSKTVFFHSRTTVNDYRSFITLTRNYYSNWTSRSNNVWFKSNAWRNLKMHLRPFFWTVIVSALTWKIKLKIVSFGESSLKPSLKDSQLLIQHYYKFTEQKSFFFENKIWKVILWNPTFLWKETIFICFAQMF